MSYVLGIWFCGLWLRSLGLTQHAREVKGDLPPLWDH
jgi:hypothetical protein